MLPGLVQGDLVLLRQAGAFDLLRTGSTAGVAEPGANLLRLLMGLCHALLVPGCLSLFVSYFRIQNALLAGRGQLGIRLGKGKLAFDLALCRLLFFVGLRALLGVDGGFGLLGIVHLVPGGGLGRRILFRQLERRKLGGAAQSKGAGLYGGVRRSRFLLGLLFLLFVPVDDFSLCIGQCH